MIGVELECSFGCLQTRFKILLYDQGHRLDGKCFRIIGIDLQHLVDLSACLDGITGKDQVLGIVRPNLLQFGVQVHRLLDMPFRQFE